MKLLGCHPDLEKLGNAYFFILGWKSWKNILLIKILARKAGNFFRGVHFAVKFGVWVHFALSHVNRLNTAL